jgi:hypothetical protein
VNEKQIAALQNLTGFHMKDPDPITTELATFFINNTPDVKRAKALSSGTICVFFGEDEKYMVEFDGWKIRLMYVRDGEVLLRDCSPRQGERDENITKDPLDG